MTSVRETTNPATADCGMRQFVVVLDEFTEVTLVISQNRDASAPGEPVRLEQSLEPVTNADLTTALIQLAAKAVSAVGTSL